MVHDNHINRHRFQESGTSLFSINSTECQISNSYLNVDVPFAGTHPSMKFTEMRSGEVREEQ